MGGSLPESEIRDVLKLCHLTPKEITTFIETGTYKADTTLEASKVFDHVYSIELVEQLYKESKVKCAETENIYLFLGNTLELLPKIVVTAVDDGAMFFIDAHQSGIDTSHIGKNVPCLEEIDTILTVLPKETDAIFIVDDLRLFCKCMGQHKHGACNAPWDWVDINLTTIEDVFKKHDRILKQKLIRNDRFILKI